VRITHFIDQIHPWFELCGWQSPQHRQQAVEVAHAGVARPEGVGRVLLVLIRDESADGFGVTGVEQGAFRGVGWCHA
jgi:hypothetical protein